MADGLGIERRRFGSGLRYHFGVGEKVLSAWMADNALVSWIVYPIPWEVEHQLISYLDVPLNLDGNSTNSFYPHLKGLRAAAVKRANQLPVLANPGVGGR